jgi:putative transposase
MALDSELIDKLLADCKRPEQIIGENGLLKQLTKAILERAMNAELTDHLGYEKHDPAGYNTGNSRNGKSRKKIKGDFGEIELETPRDRDGSFEPKIIGKHQTRFTGFDDKIVSMYARGMTTRDIQAHLKEMYGVEVSPSLISGVTDAVIDEVKAWQNRPLDRVYPIVYLDALYVKMRDGLHVQNRAIYVAIGVNVEGSKEVLGLWASANEGAKFWLQVLTEMRNRGIEDMFISCVDGLKGFPEAIETVYPKTQVQLCIVHLVRASLNYVSWKQRRRVAADLRLIYTAPTAEEAERQLEAFASRWDPTHPTISQIWRRNWQRIIPFFAFPPDIRRVIYTTNAVESLHMTLRKVTKIGALSRMKKRR